MFVPMQKNLTFSDNFKELACVSILIVGTSFLYIKGIGSYGLWDPWEPKYAQTVREMIDRGDYLTPYFNGEIRWTKPILIYWLIILPTKIFGNNEFSARLPSCIAAIFGVLVTYYFLRKLKGRKTGLMGACILATLPQYFFLARQAMPDMLLAAFLAAAMGFFALGRFQKEQSRFHFILFYVSLGIATLAKGPLAIVITFSAVFLFFLVDFPYSKIDSIESARVEVGRWLALYHINLFFIILVAVAGPWYIAIYMKHGGTFIKSFLIWENINRFFGSLRGHSGTVDFYIKTLFHGMFPWGSFLPVGLLFYFWGEKENSESFKIRWYFLAWFIAIFLVLTFCVTKQQHYLLPITPSIAVIVALMWEQYFKVKPAFWVRPVLLLSIAFAFIPIRDFIVEDTAYIFSCFNLRDDIYFLDLGFSLKLFFVMWAICIVFMIVVNNSRVLAACAVLIAYTYGLYFSHYVIPNQSKYKTLKYYIDFCKTVKKDDDKFILYGWGTYSMWYYTNLNFKRFVKKTRPQMVEYIKENPRIFMVIDKRLKKNVIRYLNTEVNFEWYTVRNDHWRSDLITNIPHDELFFAK